MGNHFDKPFLRPVTASLALLFLCLACGGSPPNLNPTEIAEGDTCTRCKQPITDKRFAAEFVTKDGFVRKFDDIACMIEHSAKVGRENITAYFTVDYDKKEWKKAETMFFLRSKNLNTPSGGGLASFADKARTEALATQFQGEAVSFETLMK